MNTANIENKDLPAFACVGYDSLGGGYQQDGLTKLEYFTAKAMQGMLAACQGFDSKGLDYLAECAVLQASAVLSQLEKLDITNK
jgi:hypothetical protein